VHIQVSNILPCVIVLTESLDLADMTYQNAISIKYALDGAKFVAAISG